MKRFRRILFALLLALSLHLLLAILFYPRDSSQPAQSHSALDVSAVGASTPPKESAALENQNSRPSEPSGSSPQSAPAARGGSGKANVSELGRLDSARPEYALARSRILSNLNYPVSLQRRRVQGTVEVEFTVGAQGEILSSKTAVSSGSNELDEQAMNAVQRSAPFQELQAIARQNSDQRIELRVPIQFSVN